MNKKTKIQFAVGCVPILLGIAFAQATPDETPCGFVLKAGKGSQVIPPKGKVVVHFTDTMPVACGAMVITHEEPFWMKTSDTTTLKIAPHTFIEIPKLSANQYRLYRGEVLVSAPPSVSLANWSTPNSEFEFKGGVALFQYDVTEKRTTAACFNRSFEFRNKFNQDAKQTVRVGEMSRLAIQDAQVVPSVPAVMNHQSVSGVVEKLALSHEDTNELVAIVKRVYDERSKSLVSELDQWKELPEKTTESGGRSIASVPDHRSRHSIEPNEANFVNQMLRQRLYGEDEEMSHAPKSRKPASVSHTQKKLIDSEKVKQDKEFGMESKLVEKEIDRLKPDSEE